MILSSALLVLICTTILPQQVISFLFSYKIINLLMKKQIAGQLRIRCAAQNFGVSIFSCEENYFEKNNSAILF
jgi:hypothetical protein